MRVRSALLLPLVLVLSLVAAPSHAVAQVIDIGPPLPPIAGIDGVNVDEHIVRAEIDGPIAEVTVTQTFRNDSGRLAEGTFLFPLPEDAAVGDFQMTVNGQVIEGQLIDSDTARRIYEETVRQIRDPALLEYAGRGLYRTSVFPIPPGESRTLQLRYSVVLDAENGLHRFTYPLRVPAASHPAERTELVVEMRSDDGLRAVYSPSHEIELERIGDRQATVRFKSEGEPLKADFELFYGLGSDAVSLNLISHKPAGEDGYFLLLAAPSVEVDSNEIVDRDVIFVLDVSGSMEGPKLAQAKEAVRYVVEHLNPGDRFNLISFSTGASLWSERLQAVSEANLDDALSWIDRLDASGSTDINRALLEALAQLGPKEESSGAPSYVLFMTDGLPTQGETDVDKIVRNAQANRPEGTSIRLFPFGVGFDVNTDLLDTLSRELGGRSRYVRPDEQIDEAVSQFYATIQTPVLSDVQVDFGDDAVVSDTYPYPIPDLFAGEQLVVTGRYRNGGEMAVALTGRVGDREIRYEYPERSLVTAGGDPFVARLWATRKIGTLVDEVRRSGPDPELIDAIVDLSMRYGIVTPFTSYLVEEPDARRASGLDRGEALAMPAQEYRYALRDSVRVQAEAAAEAPASGEEAVLASEAREKLVTAETVAEHREVRFAGGRTFISQGQVELADGTQTTYWVDTAYSDDMELETVIFASERYFQLASNAEVAEMLSLSTEILFVRDDGSAIRVTTDDSIAESAPSSGTELPDSNQDGPDEDGHDATLWQQLWRWLAGE